MRMKIFFLKISGMAFLIFLLAACGAAPTPVAATPIPPTAADAATVTPVLSRTPLPPPTRRPSQTPTPAPSTDRKPTPTDVDPDRATRQAPFLSCTLSFNEQLLSPDGDWYLCGNAGDFTAMNRRDVSWRFSTREQFGIEYYGDFRLLHWTADGKFLYFAVMNPLDGPGPITSNAEALFRMDLATGKISTILGGIEKPDAPQGFYVVSISPTSRYLAYSVNAVYRDTSPSKQLHLVDLQSGADKVIEIEPEYDSIGSFTWSKNGQQFVYKLYTSTSEKDNYCTYTYSVRFLNLGDFSSNTFIKNVSINHCENGHSEFDVVEVSAEQVTLTRDYETWVYNVESQRLVQQENQPPSP